MFDVPTKRNHWLTQKLGETAQFPINQTLRKMISISVNSAKSASANSILISISLFQSLPSFYFIIIVTKVLPGSERGSYVNSHIAGPIPDTVERV